MSNKKHKVKVTINPDGSFTFTLPYSKVRKGTKAKPSVPHEDKLGKKPKHKCKEIQE